jgi:hypothetical protein
VFKVLRARSDCQAAGLSNDFSIRACSQLTLLIQKSFFRRQTGLRCGRTPRNRDYIRAVHAPGRVPLYALAEGFFLQVAIPISL